MGADEGLEVTVLCLLVFGDQAELVPDGWDGQGEPARCPASAITADTGLEARDLPGARLLARASEQDGEVAFSGFRLLAREHPLEEVMRRQGVKPVRDVSELAQPGAFESDEELDEFLAMVYADRHREGG